MLALPLGYPLLVGFDGCFYYPDRRVYSRPDDFGLRCEDVTFRASDGVNLHGWWLPSTHRGSRGVVVHFHGNAANISNHIALACWLPPLGYDLFMFDYRGYGRSEGAPTRAGTTLDGLAAIDWAAARAEAAGLPLFAYGQSLGGAVAIVASVQRPAVRAVIAETTFGSYRRIAGMHGSRSLMLGPAGPWVAAATVTRGEDPIDVVARLSPRPLLVIAAQHDTVCFPELSRELFDAAAAPKEFWEAPGAGHLAILDGNEAELSRRIDEFLVRAGAAAKAR